VMNSAVSFQVVASISTRATNEMKRSPTCMFCGFSSEVVL
jgi:hypothetical protein